MLVSVPLCLGAPVSAFAQCPDGTPPPCASAPRPVVPTTPRVAVLYFDVASRDSNDVFLADGLTEAVIDRLVALAPQGRLSVVSRHAVRRYRGMHDLPGASQIGRTLNVGYLVTGTVRRSGGRLRVTAELTRTSGDEIIWSQPFERGDGDVFAIQEDVARRAAEGVVGRLLPSERSALQANRPHNPQAYEAYLRGNGLLASRRPAELRRAIVEYEHALQIDPTFADAQARIALAYMLRVDWAFDVALGNWRDSLLARASDAAAAAVRLDSTSSDAWMALAYVRLFAQPDTAAIYGAFRRAVALKPDNAEAWHQFGDALLITSASRAEVNDAYDRALAADPARAQTVAQSGRNPRLTLTARERLAILDSALRLNPGLYYLHASRANYLLLLGDTAGARRTRNLIATTYPSEYPFGREVNIAVVDLQLGDTAAAVQRVRAALAAIPTTALLQGTDGRIAALVLALGGDRQAAVQVASRVQSGHVRFFYIAPLRTVLRDVPEFRRIFLASRPPWSTAEP